MITTVVRPTKIVATMTVATTVARMMRLVNAILAKNATPVTTDTPVMLPVTHLVMPQENLPEILTAMNAKLHDMMIVQAAALIPAPTQEPGKLRCSMTFYKLWDATYTLFYSVSTTVLHLIQTCFQLSMRFQYCFSLNFQTRRFTTLQIVSHFCISAVYCSLVFRHATFFNNSVQSLSDSPCIYSFQFYFSLSISTLQYVLRLHQQLTPVQITPNSDALLLVDKNT